MTRKQFEILVILAKEGPFSQRQLKEKLGISLGIVNKIMQELNDLNYVKDGKITDEGFAALEPFRAKKAVFLAAGFGTRLVPITFNSPKPLVRVKGNRIIDSSIDACLMAGISEIYIVRGYLSEQFDQLLYKYPMIRFLENPSFNEANNIGSAIVARYLLSNAYVLEADIIVHNPAIITPYHYQSDYLGIKKQRVDDWCCTVNNHIIVDEQLGGEGDNCYRMVGISYWNDVDGKKLSQDIKEVYESPGGKERYWEQVPFVYKKNDYRVEIRECDESDVTEIDSLKELKSIDSAYAV